MVPMLRVHAVREHMAAHREPLHVAPCGVAGLCSRSPTRRPSPGEATASGNDCHQPSSLCEVGSLCSVSTCRAPSVCLKGDADAGQQGDSNAACRSCDSSCTALVTSASTPTGQGSTTSSSGLHADESTTATTIKSLPDHLLLHVLCMAAGPRRMHAPWAVCRAWRHALSHPAAMATWLTHAYPLGRALARAAGSGKLDITQHIGHAHDFLKLPCTSVSTSLHAAISARHLPVVQFLLAQGAQADARNNWGLALAASNGDLEMCDLLLAHGAHAKEPSTALQWAAAHGHLDVCRLLLAEGGANAREKDSWNLHVAAQRNAPNCLQVRSAMLAC